jgi:hypothetical protein
MSPAVPPDSGLACECEEHMRSACAGEPFYKKYRGKRYCVLHFPGKQKSQPFREAIDRKLEKVDFDFRGVRFPDEVSFKDIEFSGPTLFSHSIFSADVDFSSATFKEEVDFVSAVFHGNVNFREATFQAPTYFGWTNFKGNAYCASITFDANVGFGGAIFDGGAYFGGATFKGRADFGRVFFNAGTDFGIASFNCEAYFRNTSFNAVLNAPVSPITMPNLEVSFIGTTFNGEANFIGATFNAAAHFTGARFRAAASFVETTFAGDVKFGGDETARTFSPTASLNLQFARIQKPNQVFFHTISLRPHWFVNVDPRDFQFTNVKWANGQTEVVPIVRSFRHTRSLRKEAIEELDCLTANGISSPTQMLRVIYRQLAVNAEENHRYEEASRFRYLAMDTLRLEPSGRFAFWRLSWWYWLASGYGERALKAGIVLLAIWIICAWLYTMVGFVRWEPKLNNESDVASARRDKMGAPLTLKGALTYSAGVMTLQKPEPRAATTSAQTVVILETMLGPLQAALLALAIRRKFLS